MQIKDKKHYRSVDRVIVNNDYVIAQGSVAALLGTKVKGEEIYKPCLGIWKVHEGHPLAISKPGGSWSFTTVLPYMKHFGYEDGRDGGEGKAPVEVMRDKTEYDLAMFFLVPAKTDFGEKSVFKKIATIDDAFRNTIDAKDEPVELLYVDHGYDRFGGDDIDVVVPIMPTIIPKYFHHNFLHNQHKIYTYGKSKVVSVGHIDIPLEKSRDLILDEIIPLLEKRFEITDLAKLLGVPDIKHNLSS